MISIDILQMIWTVILAFLSALISYSFHKLQKWEEEKKKTEEEEAVVAMVIKEGLKAILRDRIIQSCSYFLKEGYITYVAKENIMRMYNAYTQLGGNDIATGIYEDAMKLPIHM